MLMKFIKHRTSKTTVLFVILCILLEIGVPAAAFCMCNGINIGNTTPVSRHQKESSFGISVYSHFNHDASITTGSKNNCHFPKDTHFIGRRSLRNSISSNRFDIRDTDELSPISKYILPDHPFDTLSDSSISNNSPRTALSNLRTVILLN